MEATVVLKEAEQRQNKILDANYEATDVNTLCRDMAHLKPTEQQKLSELLSKYPCLFKGGLGTLNIPLVKIKTRPLTQSEKPYHARAFLIPYCYEETTHKEMKQLEEI